MKTESFKVRLRKTEVYQGKRKTTHYVRWTVEGMAFKRPFDFSEAAESYKAKLRSAANDGLPFSTVTGEPVAWAREVTNEVAEEAPVIGVLDHFRDYVHTRWSRWSGHQRENAADALMNAMVALLPQEGRPAEPSLRQVLRRCAFNQKAAAPTGDLATALTWAERYQPPVTCLGDAAALHVVIDHFAVRTNGQKRAVSSQRRMRALLNTPVDRAVYAGHIPTNLLQTHPDFKVKKTARTSVAVDKRVCANVDQAERLFAAVETVQWSGPRLKAFFATCFYAGLRPEEAVELRRANITLPATNTEWGEMHLEGAAPYVGPAWTDDGANREFRGLKHREADAKRIVPVCPRLVAILRRHMNTFEPGPDGRLFVSHYGKVISSRTCQKVFAKARAAAYTEAEAASPLTTRIYHLRHSCLSRWLNAGVPATQVAEWAGNSVEILLRIYAHCIDGELHLHQRKIEAAEQPPPSSPEAQNE
jgi:integrase